MQSVLIAVGFDSGQESSVDSRQKAVQWITNGAEVTSDENASQQLGFKNSKMSQEANLPRQSLRCYGK